MPDGSVAQTETIVISHLPLAAERRPSNVGATVNDRRLRQQRSVEAARGRKRRELPERSRGRARSDDHDLRSIGGRRHAKCLKFRYTLPVRPIPILALLIVVLLVRNGLERYGRRF